MCGFCSRGENAGLLPALGLCSQFYSQLHKETLGGHSVQNSSQSGGLNAQWGKRSLCPCFTLQRVERKRPPLLWLAPLLDLLVGPTNKQHQTFISVLNTMLLSFTTNFTLSV